jgi:hypothetical protein
VTDRQKYMVAAVGFFLLLVLVAFVVFGNWWDAHNQ